MGNTHDSSYQDHKRAAIAVIARVHRTIAKVAEVRRATESLLMSSVELSVADPRGRIDERTLPKEGSQQGLQAAVRVALVLDAQDAGAGLFHHGCETASACSGTLGWWWTQQPTLASGPVGPFGANLGPYTFDLVS